MSVVRVEKNKNYTTMSNYHLRDKNLSLKSKGLLSVVLSLPPEWDYSIEGLVAILKEERRAVRSTIEELIQNKYLIILKLKATKGIRNNIEYLYTFYEKPFTQDDLDKLLNSVNKDELIEFEYGINLDDVNIQEVDTQSVYLHKDTQLNKDILNTDKLNKDNKYNTTTKEASPQIFKKDIYSFIEENFGRTLAPIEYEKVKEWGDSELVRYAISKAVLNNKCNINYIDKIIFYYKRNNIQSVKQAQEKEEEYLNNKKRNDYRYMSSTEKANKEQEDFEAMLDRVLEDD